MRKKILCTVQLVIGLFLVTGALPQALAEEFYAGQTIRVVVGLPSGGGYDTYARAIARHMMRHIPGNPSFVVENMPGSDSLMAAKYVLDEAEPDGLTVVTFQGGLVLRQALGDRTVKIDLKTSVGSAPPVSHHIHVQSCDLLA